MTASTAVLGTRIEETGDTRMQFTQRNSNCFESGLLVCQIPSGSEAPPQNTKDVTSLGYSPRINRVNHRFIQNAKTSRSIKSGGAGGFLLTHLQATLTQVMQQPTTRSTTRPSVKLSQSRARQPLARRTMHNNVAYKSATAFLARGGNKGRAPMAEHASFASTASRDRGLGNMLGTSRGSTKDSKDHWLQAGQTDQVPHGPPNFVHKFSKIPAKQHEALMAKAASCSGTATSAKGPILVPSSHEMIDSYD